MDRFKKTYLRFAVMFAVLSVAGSALAQATSEPPPNWGDLAVEGRVGGRIVNNIVIDQVVLWKRKDNGDCFIHSVFPGGFFALGGLIVNGRGGKDTLIAQGPIQEDIICNGTSVKLGQAGAFFQPLILKGNNGNDSLFGGIPVTEMHGGSAGDLLVGEGGGALDILINGGPTGDSVEAFGLANNERLRGEGGDDCLWDASLDSIEFACGAGNDSFRRNIFESNETGCDLPVTCCTWGTFIGAC